jgi:hypothetical protein
MADARATDNFGNDGARAYLAMLAAKLVATVTEILGGGERLDLDEDGESMFMPSVELLALLCERYDARPPRPESVKHWAEKYLAVYDAQIDKQKPKVKAEYKAGRRRAIENTFRWLEGLAESYWQTT